MASDKEQPQLTGGALAATCPFMRTLVVNNPELYDENMRTMSRGDLRKFVQNQRAAGAQGDLERVLSFFANLNQTPLKTRFNNHLQSTDRFSTHFPSSGGDHEGSTDIYRTADGRFDAAAFDRVVAHSANGTTMTPSDIVGAIIESNALNNGKPIDLFKSAGEFALLFMLLHQAGDPPVPQMEMSIAELRTLFEHNQWPPNALHNLGTAKAKNWLEMTSLIGKEIVSRKGGSLRGQFGKFAARIRRDVDQIG